MLQSIKRTVGSGGVDYDVTINFDGMNEEQVQQDAVSFYVWKLQRQMREAGDAQKETWKREGIVVHAQEVGKKILSTEEIVDKMTTDQAEKAYERLKAKLGR